MPKRLGDVVAALGVLMLAVGCGSTASGDGAKQESTQNASESAKSTAKADAKKPWRWPRVVISKETTYFTEPLRPTAASITSRR